MRFLNFVRLMVSSGPGSTAGVAGAVYFDATTQEPLYHDGSSWNLFGRTGFPDPVTNSLVVPVGRQVMYFDRFTNDGIVAISDGAVLVGLR